MHPQDFLSIFHGFIFFLLYGSSVAQRRGLGRGGNQVVDFDCPEEFGYYPHPTDCTQYYVCVFGGALLESCTGGLMYSHELQTCDWPRNVGCGGGSGGDAGTISTVRVTDPRTRTPPQQRTSSSPQQSLQAQLQQQQPARTSQREEALRQRQAQEIAQQQQQQQQQVVYEDELGPAEEIESDRQQRVYRGQPSTLGQVQRDRDGLRPVKNAIHTHNVIPSGPGTAEKVSLVSYGSQRVSQPRQQEQYSYILTEIFADGLANISWTDDNTLDLTDVYEVHSRHKRQAPYRLSGQPGRTSHSGNVGPRPRKIPVILIPDKFRSHPQSYSQPVQTQYVAPSASSTAYGHSPNQPFRNPHRATSYNSQNNENYHIVHNYDQSNQKEVMASQAPPSYVKYSDADNSPSQTAYYDQPSESQFRYEQKYPPPPPPTVPYPKKHHVVEFGYQNNFHDSYRPQNLFFPANNSHPDLDIVKLTKETIQTAFRPLRPKSGLEKFSPTKHTFPQALIPQNFFQALLESSNPPQEAFTLMPSTTPSPIFLESSTRAPEVRIPNQVTVPTPSYRPSVSVFTLEPSVEVPVQTTQASPGPTRIPLFEPVTVSKKKRKKTTTLPPPTVPSSTATSYYGDSVTFSSYTEPVSSTTPPPRVSSTFKFSKNDHRFYVPPAKTTERVHATSEKPNTRRKPIRQKIMTTTPSTTTAKKEISEEYYENFKPFPTQTPPTSSTYGKRQRLRLKPTTMTTTSTTTNEDKVTVTHVTHVTYNRTSTKNVRVEPAQEYHVTTPSAPVRYNTSARYQQPTQYDQYYQLYDEDADVYKTNQYSQPQQQQPRQQQQPQPQPLLQQQQAPSSTARSPVQQYRGQSSYKQQTVQLEPQRDTYSQDTYAEEPASQDYSDQDEQQYQQLASPKPSRSEGAQENRRADTLSAPSIDRPLVTNETARRSDSFDPAILAPPPRSPPTFLTPPNNERSYYVDHLPKIQNKEALVPPKNGGALAKSFNNFDSVLTSFFDAVTQTRFDGNSKSAPETILRSEIGRINHEPIVETKPDVTTIKTPVIYQELPDKDFQTFFVEIEPRRPKTPSGFFITKPQEATETVPEKNEPIVEITREQLVNPESQEIVYSPLGPALSNDDRNKATLPQRLEPQVELAVLPNVDVLPLRAPGVKFNPSVEELEYLSYRKRPTTTSSTTTTTTTQVSTTTTTTARPRVRVTEEAPKINKNPTPYQFIVVSTETPAPFARNPENEYRSDSRLTFRPEIRSRNQFADSLVDINFNPGGRQRASLEDAGASVSSDNSRENASKERQRVPEVRFSSRYAGSTETPTSSESTKQYGSWEQTDEGPVTDIRPKNSYKNPPTTKATVTVGRTKFYSSKEAVDRETYHPKPRSRSKYSKESLETTADPASYERTKQYSSREEVDRLENHHRKKFPSSSAESTERAVSAERTKLFSSREEVQDSVLLDPTEPSITTTTTTTKRPTIRIRTTTEPEEPEYRKPARKVIKLHRGELKNQRLSGPKVKRIRKPSTQSPAVDDLDERAFTRENEVHSTLRPIVVGGDLDGDKNATRFRFTVEDDAEFAIMPKNKAHLYSSTSTTEEAIEPEEEDEKRVVRPAYEPINLDTLDSAEEPIPARPSTEPSSPKPTKSTTRNPDHDRVTAKPSRGRPSLKPRLRTTTASPDSQASVAHTTPLRQRGGSSYNLGVGNDITPNRGTPAPSRGTRPTLKPSTAIVSKASEFIDIYKYPPSRPANLYATPIPDKSAAKCRKDVCLLPDCSCGGKEIPGGYSAEEIPQLVLLTFDDSVNDLNKGLYADLFERGRVNPNGCPISATFYVSHEWTDYSQVQNLYANGHEMASHSVSHSFGEQFSQKKWTREVAGQREILSAYGGVRLEDIRGMRAPFLAVGGNKMFKMLYDANFTYDSSMPIYENKPPSWPYTLDYKLFHDCMIPPCPTKSYPGVWEVPMVMWQDLNGGRCSMGDACSNPPTADGVYKMLIKNFERHFTTNRAPFGLFYHAAWFTHEHHKEGFIAFMDTIVNMPEVWLVTNWQALQWVRDPQPLSTVNNFPAFQCNEEKAKKCNNPKVCNLWHKSGVRYMRTCQPCPEVYPWTGKTGIRNSRVDNEIIDE